MIIFFWFLPHAQKPAAEEEEDLPDLNDPEVNKAATKIQAHFKGHLVRKTLKDPKDADASNWLNTPFMFQSDSNPSLHSELYYYCDETFQFSMTL